MRKALVVGIDFYPNLSNLNGCVNDASSVASILERNYDGTLNFNVKKMLATGKDNAVSRACLEDSITELFSGTGEVAILYFSGHGYTENENGYLITSDSTSRGRDGVKMEDVIEQANKSKINNKIIILDCCHAGEMGTAKYFNNVSIVGEGVTILSACTKGQYALETKGHGVFTSLLIDALYGGAADIMGNISPGGIYAYIDRALGPWSQRPVFKTNVESFVSLRTAKPSLEQGELIQIDKIFQKPDEIFPLDPSFEPESDMPNIENTKVFAVLQKMESVNLVVPVGEEHMYHAAINSKGCKLTPLGLHYWTLVNKKLI